MNRFRRRATQGLVVTGALVATLASAGVAMGAAPAPVDATAAVAPAPPPLGAFPTPSGSFPAEWRVMVDDTRTIAMAAPPSWGYVDTMPAGNSDGSARPWISATANQSLFFPAEGVADTYSAPGVVYVAVTERDTLGVLAASPSHEVCAAQPVQTFSNATFSGHIQAFANCGGTATQMLQIAATPADQSFTAVVLVQLTGGADDAAVLDGILSSLGRHVEPTA